MKGTRIPKGACLGERFERAASTVESNPEFKCARKEGKQSSDSNLGEHKKISNAHVLNSCEGKLYRGEDPLLGGANLGESVWPRLGDLLIERKLLWHGDFHPCCRESVGDGPMAARRGHSSYASCANSKCKGQWVGDWTPAKASWRIRWKMGTGKPARQQFPHAILSSIRQKGVASPVYVSEATRCQWHKGRLQRSKRHRSSWLISQVGFILVPTQIRLGLSIDMMVATFSAKYLTHSASLARAITREPVSL